MINTIIYEHERGLLYKKGKLISWLEPGRHTYIDWFNKGDYELKRIDLNECYYNLTPELQKILPKTGWQEILVPGFHIALLTVNNRPRKYLWPGEYAVWQMREKIDVTIYPYDGLFSDIPEGFAVKLAEDGFEKWIIVRPYENVLLYVNGFLEKVLEAGKYRVNCWSRTVETITVDLREQELQIVGQEVMSADKVTLRLNIIIKYQIVDVVKSIQSVVKLQDALYSEAQIITRCYVARVKIDDLLENRMEASSNLISEFQLRADAWGVKILRVDLKDIILPGEMKSLLNQVIEAEKKAAAQFVMRREEIAATRSLANTARMLENNPVLLRLKELEAWKEIAERINQLTVIAGTNDLMGRFLMPTSITKETQNLSQQESKQEYN